MFGSTPVEIRQDKNRSLYLQKWHQFVEEGGFRSLKPMHGARYLIDMLNELDSKQYNVCILSSAGGFSMHREVQEQKLQWLNKHGINWPAVIVPGRRYKAGFATPNSLMIDDTKDVCTDFIAHGGSAVHYIDVVSAQEEVKKWIA